MNPRTTWWLAGVAAALLAYIYFAEWRESRRQEQATQLGRLLPRLDPAAVSHIEIVRSNGTVRAELANDQWQLVNPAYPAQSTAIESFLTTLREDERRGREELLGGVGGPLSRLAPPPPL